MNTVDALLELGKALCGNDFELAPNMTDAEAIREIARNYQPPEGGGSEGADKINYFEIELDNTEDNAVTPFADIVEATKNCIPCVIVGEPDAYIGVGQPSRIINGVVTEVTFIYFYHFRIDATYHKPQIDCTSMTIANDGSITWTQGTIISA